MDSANASVFTDAAPADDGSRGRAPLLLIGQLRVAGQRKEISVRIRNLSAGGLMVELPDPVSPDSGVQIEVGELGWVSGRVAWQTEGRAGIAFDQPIDPARAGRPNAA